MPIKPTWPQVEPSWAKLGQVEQEDEQETTSRLTPRWQPFTTAVTSVQKRDDCLTHNSTCVNGFGWLTHRLAASQSNANCLIEMECFQLHRWVHSDLINYPPVLINCGPCDVPDSTHSSPSCTWCVHSNLPAHFFKINFDTENELCWRRYRLCFIWFNHSMLLIVTAGFVSWYCDSVNVWWSDFF